MSGTRDADRDAYPSVGGLDRRQLLGRGAAVAAALGAAGVGALADAQDAPAQGATPTASGSWGVLKLRTPEDLGSADPAFDSNNTDGFVTKSVFEGLVGFRAGSWDVVNVLAESLEPSADGRRYAFKLKRGIPFQKGYGEITAADVKYSFERIANLTKPRLNSAYKADWPGLQRVRVTGKYSGVIELKQYFAPLMVTTLPHLAGMVVPEKAVKKLGKKFGVSPIGSGPYEFDSWKPKSSVTLSRFADWGGAGASMARVPQWSQIVLIPIADQNATEIALETGAVDAGYVSPLSVSRFANNSKFNLHTRSSLGYTFIGMNIMHPNLKDVHVRQAIRSAIDVPSIMTAAFEGKYKRASAILSPNYPLGYWKDAPVYNRDVDKAKAFLSKAAGVPSGLSLVYGDDPGAATVAQIVQSNLKDVGIALDVQHLDPGAYWQTGKTLQERQLTYIVFASAPDPYFATEWFTCAQFDIYNWMYWCDARFDGLNSSAVHQRDKAKRNAAYIEMQKRWDAAANAVWIAWPSQYIVSKKNIKLAIQPSGHMYPPWAARPV